MPNHVPFAMTREQLQKLGPVQSVPRPDQLRQEQSRADIESKLKDLRELAMLAGNNRFMAYVQNRQAVAIQTMLIAKDDEDRRNAQAYARAWTAIHRDIVTALEQSQELEKKLST
jgi:hypothetical protein